MATPTAEDIAAYEAVAGPPPINPLRDLSAEDIAALAVEDKNNFVIPDEFQRQTDLHGDPATVQKVADALNIVKQRGFKLRDLPTAGEAGKAVATAGKGLVGQLWNYANVAGNIAAGAISEVVGAEGLAQGYAEDINRRLASNIAGTEEAVSGLSQLAEKGIKKAGRAAGVTKDFSQFTPEERVADLFEESGKSQVRTERLSGKGEFAKAVTGGESETAELRPEKVAELAAGDPLSFFVFGKAAQLGGQALGAVTPAAVKGAVSAATQRVTQAAEQAIPAVVGGAVTAGGVVAKGAAKAVEKTAPVVLPIAGAIKGGSLAAPVGGLPGAIGGAVAGRAAGRAVARGAEIAGRAAENIADLGRQVAGSVPITSAYAQAGRDFLQALPGATGTVAKGALLDVGLAAATAEVPQDTQSAIGFGTALGALGAAKRVGGRLLSGQLIGPRGYGIDKVIPSSGQFPTFDALHTEAMKTAPPGVRARLNAIRQFVGGSAPGTDVFLARDAAAVEQALLDSGVAPEIARQWAQQSGFLTASLPGRDGKPRRVAIVRDVDTAPHEAFHAVQDVLGEEANQKIDAIIREEYSQQWDAEGQRYAERLTGQPRLENWRAAILDASGWGLLEAKEKIYRDIYNRMEAETGARPDLKLVEEMAKAELGRQMDAAVVANPDVDPNQVAQHVWRDILSPEDINRVSDRYIAREIAAENFDAIFKNQGPRLEEGKQIPERLARIVGGVVSAFGGEPLAGRVSEFGQVGLRTPVVEAVRGAALPTEIAPAAASRPAPKVTLGATPVDTAAEEARSIAADAPDTPTERGTKSPREILGEVAEAIAQQAGVKINYLSALDEPAAATTSNRAQRRAMIEAFRSLPPEARALWEKTFFPERVIRLKSGKYQVLGWAPEVFAANAHKLARFLADTPAALALSPYSIDPKTKTFTPEAWQQLYQDTQTFVQNQTRGATGAGEPLVVPKSATEAGAFAPQTRPGAVPLDQVRADFINMLFNFRLPDTPRIQTGRRPLNIVGQEVSAATKPGRVEVPVRPRGEFTGPEAERQGIAGREIAEVNPLRNQIESVAQSAGKAMPEFIESVQRLNLENIKELELAPEQPQFRGNTLTLTAGFQPPREVLPSQPIKPASSERQWRVSGQIRGANRDITVTAQDIAAARRQAESQGMRVAKVASAAPIEQTTAMFQPKSAAEIAALTPDEFNSVSKGFTGRYGGGLTGLAFELGASVTDASGLDALRTARAESQAKIAAARSSRDLDTVFAETSKSQLFREAIEAATGEGNSEKFIQQNYDPEFKSPLKQTAATEQPTAQAQPKPAGEIQDIAEQYNKSIGLNYRRERPYAALNEALLIELADHYQAAKHSPSADDVKKSYAALAKETIDQYNAIIDAGYTLEPWTGEGEPYKSSADMIADVRENKHLYYFRTERGFGEKRQAAAQENVMLEDSGVEIGGEPAPINDIFRAVHDFFGHAKEGYQFGPRGEFNAWGSHSEMYSPDAQGALAAETLAQNAFVNYGPHMRETSGRIRQKGDPGFLSVPERPFAEQKNTVVPKELLEQARAQFSPEKKIEEFRLRPGSSGFSKAWILPDGTPVQLGGKWHHQWVNDNPDIVERYGLKTTESGEENRVDALKAGFARINYAINNGQLRVEARAKDWRRLRPAIERFAEENIDKIDSMSVMLFDDSVNKTVDRQSKDLFNFDTDEEKLANLPMPTGETRLSGRLTEGPEFFEPPAQYQPKRTVQPKGKEREKPKVILGVVVNEDQVMTRPLRTTEEMKAITHEDLNWDLRDKFRATPDGDVFWWNPPSAEAMVRAEDKLVRIFPELETFNHVVFPRLPNEQFQAAFKKAHGGVSEIEMAHLTDNEVAQLQKEIGFTPVQFQPRKAKGADPADVVQRVLRQTIRENRERYPEALPLQFRTDDDGNIDLTRRDLRDTI